MQIVSARGFKDMARTGKALPGDVLVHKDLPAVVEVVSDRVRRFVVSTAAVDREFDVIAQEGWDLEPYRRNPVVMWDHGMSIGLGRMTIARATEVGLVEGQLVATAEFDPADMPVTGAWAEAILRKLDNGSLAAVSVGFRPLDWSVPEGESARGDTWVPGINFLRQEMLEFSVVAIPCNPEALVIPPPAGLASGPAPAVVETSHAAALTRARHRSQQLLALAQQ